MFYQTQTAHRPPKESKMLFFPGDLNLWPWPSNSSERGPKTSWVSIWHKSTQQFWRYYIHKQKLEAKDVLFYINRTQATERAENVIFVPVTLTYDLERQTHPSKRSNMSSVWIWRKSSQRFLRYFMYKQKPQTDGAKNRTFSSLRAVITH